MTGDVCMVITAALLDLDEAYEYISVILYSGIRYLLTGKNLPPKCGHKKFSLKENASPRYFMMIKSPY